MNITIGMPFRENVYCHTMFGVIAIITNMKQINWHYSFTDGAYVAANRNTIVRNALRQPSSHLLWIDADVVFDETCVQKLIDADKDIIGATYNFKHLPLQTMVITRNDKGQPIHPYVLPKEPFKCVGIPAGFSLIKLDVYRNIKPPWYWVDHLEGDPDPGAYMTEDIYFCEKATKAGYEIWCEPNIKIFHKGSFHY